MVSIGLCLLDSIALMETVVKISQIYALVLDSSQVDTTKVTKTPEVTPRVEESKAELSVKQYARNELCRNFDGKKYFYNAMKSKFCSLKSTFAADFVVGLCRQRDYMLDRWVAELFDIDGDGYITHYERSPGI